MLTTEQLKSSIATTSYCMKGSGRMRLLLNDEDNKTRIAVIEKFLFITEFFDKLLSRIFKKDRKWVRVSLNNPNNHRQDVLLSVNSLCHRTLLTRKEIFALSPQELSKLLTNPQSLMWTRKPLEQLFPQITLISCKESNHLNQSFDQHLQVIGERSLPYEKITPVVGSSPREQFIRAHLEALKLGKAKNQSTTLIIEENARFHPQRIAKNTLQKILTKELPQEWGILFLGCRDLQLKKTTNYSDNLICPKEPRDTHCYAVNSSLYDTLINALETALTDSSSSLQVDQIYAQLLSKHSNLQHKVFAIKEPLAFKANNDSKTNLYPQENAVYNKSFLSPLVEGSFTVDKMPVMDPLLAGSLYQMTHLTTQVFDRFGIRYWADGGTILGMERHGGLIPHDDDVDF